MAQVAARQPRLSDPSRSRWLRWESGSRPNHATLGKISKAMRYPFNADERSPLWRDTSAHFRAATRAVLGYAVFKWAASLNAEMAAARWDSAFRKAKMLS